VTLWPPELARFIGRERVLGGPEARGPRVVSPIPGSEIVSDGRGPVVLLKSEGAEGPVHWYLDDAFVRTAGGLESVTVAPGPGRHKVSLMDSRARTASGEFTVIRRAAADEGRRPAPLLVFD
jgi:membrane carboxypeptidase/penicillin-binding protein PbpC